MLLATFGSVHALRWWDVETGERIGSRSVPMEIAAMAVTPAADRAREVLVAGSRTRDESEFYDIEVWRLDAATLEWAGTLARWEPQGPLPNEGLDVEGLCALDVYGAETLFVGTGLSVWRLRIDAREA